MKKLENLVLGLTSRVSKLEGGSKPAAAPAKATPAPAKKVEAEEDDDGNKI